MPLTERYAIATPSFAGDLRRCELLCASVDLFVSGFEAHYLLIEDQDVALFQHLAGPRRVIVRESDILPPWFKSLSNLFRPRGRRVWTGARALLKGVPPLRGWHAQQLRKMALPLHIPQDVVLFADSDLVFVRPFAMDGLARKGRVRLHRAAAGVDASMPDHQRWLGTTATLLGIAPPTLPAVDYVTHLVAWRTDAAREMLRRIESVSGRDWVSAVGRQRHFSEYTIYGWFVDKVLHEDIFRHAWADRSLALSCWSGDDVAGRTAGDIFGRLEAQHVAVAIQSFIGSSMPLLNELMADALRNAASTGIPPESRSAAAAGLSQRRMPRRALTLDAG